MRKVSLFLVALLALSATVLVGCTPEKLIVSGDFYVQADDPRDDDYYLGSVDLTDEPNMPIDYVDADYVLWNVDTVFSSGRTVPFDWTISKTGADPETSAPRIWQKGSDRASVKMELDGSRFGLIFDASVGYNNNDGVGITTWTAQKSCLMATDWSGEGEGEGEGETVPVITDQPDTLTANVGDPVEFTIVATGGNLHYQWQDNGIDITPNEHSGGVNTATLTIYSVGEINEGAYRCRVWNSQGSVYSNPAILTVTGGSIDDTTPPVITLNGASTIYLSVGGSWVDPGATAVDNVDGTIAVTKNGTVNTSVSGTYYVTYTATDAAGNTGTATRTVIVGNDTEPTGAVRMNYTFNLAGRLQMEFIQDSATLQECMSIYGGFPSGKTWSDVQYLGTMFMAGTNPLLYVESNVGDGAKSIELYNGSFANGWSARAVPYLKLKGSDTRYFFNTGKVAGYNNRSKMSRSDGDNYDLALYFYKG
ncbi:MAG: immunoglobulin-like domain-containing protein [Candidatus Buchananbacteria bacterium]